MIRKARIEEAEEIQQLINYYAKGDLLLQRSLSEIYSNIREFWVSEVNERIIGTCALSIQWKSLAEIRSLAIKPRYKKRGVGKELVQRCLQEAKDMGIKKVFTLTKQKGFFEKIGFKETKKEVLPMKVWSECLHCPKFMHCDEFALIRRI